MTGEASTAGLAPLPYDYTALEPWIDAETMRLHHGSHHLQCVRGLAEAEERLATARSRGERHLIGRLQELASFYAAEHFLHSLFWEVMGPNRGGQPSTELADQLAEDFGSFAGFKWQFSALARGLEIGGWVVLAWDDERHRLMLSAGGNPTLQWGCQALLALDVREHAYYLRYQNRRGEYVHNWWNTVNWSQVGQRFAAATHARAGRSRSASDGRYRRYLLGANRGTSAELLCTSRPPVVATDGAARSSTADAVHPSAQDAPRIGTDG